MPPKGINLGGAVDIEIGKANDDPRARQCKAAGLHTVVPVDFRFAFAPGQSGPIGMLAKFAICFNCGVGYDVPPIYGNGPAGGDPNNKNPEA